jgi:curved DNA-binding protein CbpA
MPEYVNCSHCNKTILEGLPFCPHCGKKQLYSKGTEFKSKDPYLVLQVTRNAGKEDIEAGFKKLSKIYHPDINKNPDAELLMQEINWAHDILSNSAKRNEYDKHHHDEKPQSKKVEDFHKEERGKDPSTNQPSANKTPSSTVSKPKTSGIEKTGITNQLGYIFIVLTIIFVSYYFLSSSIPKNIKTPIITITQTNIKSTLLAKTQTVATISKTLKYSTSWDYIDAAIKKGDQHLAEYANKTEQFTSTTYYYIEDLRTNSVLWGGSWCSHSTDILNDNWNKLLISYQINSETIPRTYFRSYDYDYEIDIPDRGKQSAKCRSELIVLYDWQTGSYRLNISYTIDNDLNDGWNTYPAKTYFQEIFIVNKNSLLPTVTQEIRKKPTPTPSCVPWYAVSDIYVGEYICVYGRIAKIQWSNDENPVYAQIIRFSKVPGAFLLRSRDRVYMDISVGDCVAFYGTVNWDTYLFMEIGETTKYNYKNCD